MKTIKVKFLGFENCPLDKCAFYEILQKRYIVEETEEADYVICSVFGTPYEYCKYPQVRIMYSGENFVPDFNLIDYAISPYPIKFYDRSFYYPSFANGLKRTMDLENLNREYNKDILKSKKYFANFIAGHESEYNIRGDFFKKLSSYKRVESPGRYLNNMENGEIVDFMTDSKTNFQKKCKFSLCFESTNHKGFVTEKIVDSFYSGTIPIYYGSDEVKNIFNEKAFINCGDYSNYEEILERIIELDSDDDKYMEMLREPIFVNPNFASEMYEALEQFLVNIFEQPLESAYRRSRCYLPQYYNNILDRFSNILENDSKMTLRKIYIQTRRQISKLLKRI